MSARRFLSPALIALMLASLFSLMASAQTNSKLISIDGMHSLDFANCSKGVPVFGE
jgi:hypothetical protein